jgi:hypothetical protein
LARAFTVLEKPETFCMASIAPSSSPSCTAARRASSLRMGDSAPQSRSSWAASAVAFASSAAWRSAWPFVLTSFHQAASFWPASFGMPSAWNCSDTACEKAGSTPSGTGSL